MVNCIKWFFFAFLSLPLTYLIGQEQSLWLEGYDRKWPEAKLLLQEGNYDALLRWNREKGEKLPNQTLKGQSLILAAFAHLNLLQIDSALFYLDLAKASFSRPEHLEGLALVERNRGYLFLRTGDREQSISSLNKAVQLANRIDRSLLEYESLHDLALLYSGEDEHQKALQSLNKALVIAKAEQQSPWILYTYNQLSTNYYSLGKLDSGIYFFEQFLEEKEESGLTENALTDWQTLGKLYLEQGSYEKAQTILLKALQAAETQKDSLFIAGLCTDLAKVYSGQSLWNNAMLYAKRGAEIAQVKGLDWIEATNLQLLASGAKNQAKPELAIQYYEEALTLFQTLKNSLGVADVQLELSKLYQSENDYQTARSYIKQALELRQGNEDNVGLLQTRLMLGELEWRANNLAAAASITELAYDQAQSMAHRNGRAEALRLLSRIYQEMGETGKALNYLTAFVEVNDSLVSEATTRAIGEWEVRYQTEKKDKDLLAKQVELDSQILENRRQYNQILILFSAFLFVALSFLFFYLISRKNRQLEKERISTLKKEQEAANLRAVMEGEEKERKRIAQDLHDGLGAMLATVKMRMQSLENDLPEVRAQEGYAKAEEQLDAAFLSIREISRNMMPAALEAHGLQFALEDLCGHFNRAKGLQVAFIPHGLDRDFDSEFQTIVFRIVQELLRNVEKHAQAKEVIVQIAVEDHALNLIVEDDGVGFNPDVLNPYQGLGIQNIHSRVEYLGGRFQIESTPNEGSTFTIDIPINE